MIETSLMAQNVRFRKCLSLRYIVCTLHGYRSFKIGFITPKMALIANEAFWGYLGQF